MIQQYYQARTQPLSKGGYIVVEQGGVRSLIVYCDDSYAVGITGPTAYLGGSGGMLPQKILEI